MALPHNHQLSSGTINGLFVGPDSPTFNVIWQTLAFGNRPFSGIDVGVDRPNLFYHIHELTNPDLPLIDILNLFPATISKETAATDIDKMLIYFDSKSACRSAAYSLRMILPQHLRGCMHPFSSDLSEACKQHLWAEFQVGKICILCATDAAGMGCNIGDVKYCIVVHCPKALAAVLQRWGRAGRNRTIEGMCLLLVQAHAFYPSQPAQVILSLN
ncbi:hypothetical protein V5O48_018762 [Marasmius crinis-equi]|uniref:DNA 3'-5' helicase n=1 Tax=Marasmius crinis-equi TaxID=585013 RepID=A0ABR3EKA9_9AGAR